MSAIKSISPLQAQEILQSNPQAKLIDVRTSIEYSFVGHPIGAIHIPFKRPPKWDAFLDFNQQVAATIDALSTPLILMCRSGARSMDAAKVLEKAGYQNLYNMDQGFEGDKDAHNHRSTLNGWRFHNLPWEQS